MRTSSRNIFGSTGHSRTSCNTTTASSALLLPQSTRLSFLYPRSFATTVPKKDTSTGNLFLDYAGTIFLGTIGLIVGWLVRSYLNTQRRNMVRDSIEEFSVVDPIELDDLRTANDEVLTIESFTHVVNVLLQDEIREISYPEFVTAVRSILMKRHDNNAAYTIQLGHLMDRVALSVLVQHRKKVDDVMPMSFWLTVLSLALSSSVTERIRALYNILQAQSNRDQGEEHQFGTDTTPVAKKMVIELVGFLQETCQLVPDAQVVQSMKKYPLQEYMVGTPDMLVDRFGLTNNEESVSTTNVTTIDFETMSAILQSQSVCAWGSCYSRKKQTA